jgi:hypothetical protein
VTRKLSVSLVRVFFAASCDDDGVTKCIQGAGNLLNIFGEPRIDKALRLGGI